MNFYIPWWGFFRLMTHLHREYASLSYKDDLRRTPTRSSLLIKGRLMFLGFVVTVQLSHFFFKSCSEN